ncbi:hypothetical protein QOZ99_004222 [Angulomicrobium amanitiforme]|uniref:Uncharacterized protein n=1 Tax=Ancylobacter amanitiformis TaxID=217069 RepID=A0ABU0LX95_9HYPH|nr:hypothetical protein [Ancylobacter amanitiformis]
MLERIEVEFFGLDRPSFADELVRREAFEGLEPAVEIAGRDDVGEVAFELAMVVTVVPFDGRVLDGPAHPFDLGCRCR